MLERKPGFGDLLAMLEKADVRYVLVGSYAMAAHGSDDGCQDLDLFYDHSPVNMTALVSALAPFHPRLRGVPPDAPFVWDVRILKAAPYLPLVTNKGDVDLLGRINGVETFEGMWNRAAVINVSGVPVRVPCLDDLVAMKTSTGREVDKLFLETLFITRQLGERRRSAQ